MAHYSDYYFIPKAEALAALELLGFKQPWDYSHRAEITTSKMLTETVRLEVRFTKVRKQGSRAFYCHSLQDATHLRITAYPSEWSSLFGKGCRASEIWDERDRLHQEFLQLCAVSPHPEHEDVLVIVD